MPIHVKLKTHESQLKSLGEMNKSQRYIKVVEWSDEDQCYIGSSPGLMFGGCHGDDEKAVFAELCEIVEEVIELYLEDGKALPPPTAGYDLASIIQEAKAHESEPAPA